MGALLPLPVIYVCGLILTLFLAIYVIMKKYRDIDHTFYFKIELLNKLILLAQDIYSKSGRLIKRPSIASVNHDNIHYVN